MNEQETIHFRAETTHNLPAYKEFQQAAALTNPVAVISSCLIFYRDAQWAKIFTDLTGVLLYSSAREMYYGIS